MTVTNTLDRFQYAGDGTTTGFPFPVVFTAPADISVALTMGAAQVPVTVVLNGGGTYDYQVIGTPDPQTGEYLSGATVAFNTAPPAGYTVTLWREPPITQLVAFAENDPLPAGVLNAALDKGAMISQYLDDQLQRAICAPWTDPPPPSAPNMTLPPVATRAGQLVSFDSAGNVIVVPPAGSFTTGNFVANMAALRATIGAPGEQAVLTGYYTAGDKPMVLYTWQQADSRSDDGGAVINPTGNPGSGRWNLDIRGGPYSVLDWGADPTGATASDGAFNNCIAAAITAGAAVQIPAGHYVFASPQYWNVSSDRTSPICIAGAGSGLTRLDFSTVNAAPALLIGASADIFRLTIDGLTIIANVAGPAVQIGHEDFSDPINTSRIGYDFNVQNNSTSAAACAVEANSFLNGILWGEFNCAGHGDALRLRQVQFSMIGGSHSTADYCHHWTAGYSFGNIIVGADLENVSATGNNILVDVTTASRNTYLGGQFVGSSGGGAFVQMQAASDYFRFVGCNPGTSNPLIAGPAAAAAIWEDLFTGTSPFGGVWIKPGSGLDAVLQLDAAAGQTAATQMKSASTFRWQIAKNNATESGGNSGSDLIVTRYNDAGGAIDNPISIQRSTGIVTIQDGLSAPSSAVFGWFGVTPVAQPTGGHGYNPHTGGSASPALYDTAWDGGVGSQAYTVFDLVRALKLLGLIAS
jgi:hypothetical protein